MMHDVGGEIPCKEGSQKWSSRYAFLRHVLSALCCSGQPSRRERGSTLHTLQPYNTISFNSNPYTRFLARFRKIPLSISLTYRSCRAQGSLILRLLLRGDLNFDGLSSIAMVMTCNSLSHSIGLLIETLPQFERLILEQLASSSARELDESSQSPRVACG